MSKLDAAEEGAALLPKPKSTYSIRTGVAAAAVAFAIGALAATALQSRYHAASNLNVHYQPGWDPTPDTWKHAQIRLKSDSTKCLTVKATTAYPELILARTQEVLAPRRRRGRPRRPRPGLVGGDEYFARRESARDGARHRWRWTLGR